MGFSITNQPAMGGPPWKPPIDVHSPKVDRWTKWPDHGPRIPEDPEDPSKTARWRGLPILGESTCQVGEDNSWMGWEHVQSINGKPIGDLYFLDLISGNIWVTSSLADVPADAQFGFTQKDPVHCGHDTAFPETS